MESHDTSSNRPGPGAVSTPVARTAVRIEGMTCSGCVRQATEALQSVPGVDSAMVSLDGGRAVVRWRRGATPDESALVAAVVQAGFKGTLQASGAGGGGPSVDQPAAGRARGWGASLWIGVVATGFLMLSEWGFDWGATSWYGWLALVLGTVVQFGPGRAFYRGAWNQLRVGASNMDTLVALGSTTAYAYSVWMLWSGVGGHLYFMEAASIITLISVGHWVEAQVGERASRALQSLLHLAPPTAVVRDATGRERDVPLAEVGLGDVMILRPGARVPTDGVVLEGASAVDESMLTGESMPVEKGPGGTIFAGTANVNGRLVARVTSLGEDTALAQVIAAVQRAQTSRANIQRLGDRVSSVFVPIVVLVALAAGVWWGFWPDEARAVADWIGGYLWRPHVYGGGVAMAVLTAAAVLIIACPCAMGLATPAAIMAGANAAARRGILIRDGVALEKAGTITAVLFDKTGTLTAGRPSVEAVFSVDGGPAREAEWRRWASLVARPSAHPLSRAVAALAAGTDPGERVWSRWQEHRGAGVEAVESLVLAPPAAAGTTAARGSMPFSPGGLSRGTASPAGPDLLKRDRFKPGSVPSSSGMAAGLSTEVVWRLGAPAWLESCGVALGTGGGARGTSGTEAGNEVPDSAAVAWVERWAKEGATILGLARGARLVAWFALRDPLKPGADAVVSELRGSGLKVYLVTGDHPAAAGAMARAVGIEPGQVFAGVRPEAKADLVRQLQAAGERVAFVGDGINDGPALEQADLGVAVSRASDVAREAADLVLLNSGMEAVPESLGLARATLRTIRQNLFWAFFYNALGIPLAALGLMSPILCAAAMGFSDLVVIGNALRLLRWKRSKDRSANRA